MNPKRGKSIGGGVGSGIGGKPGKPKPTTLLDEFKGNSNMKNIIKDYRRTLRAGKKGAGAANTWKS